jgi:hypothetical protein
MIEHIVREVIQELRYGVDPLPANKGSLGPPRLARNLREGTWLVR